MNRSTPRRTFPQSPRKQAGFSLVEVSIVAAILVIAAAIGIPAIKGFLIEQRVPAVASELQRFMSRTKVMGEGGNTVTPYAAIATAKNLVPSVRDSSVLKVSGSTVAHKLGGSGTGSNGTVALAPASLAGGALGSGFSLTLTNVNDKACPILAGTMNPVSETMTINGSTAKSLGSNGESGIYNPVMAQDFCLSGDSNVFVFASR